MTLQARNGPASLDKGRGAGEPSFDVTSIKEHLQPTTSPLVKSSTHGQEQVREGRADWNIVIHFKPVVTSNK